MAARTVQNGPYWGFTKPQLDTERARYVAARQAANSDLVGTSVNGQSYSFGERRDGSLDQWQQALQAAFYQVDPSSAQTPPPTSRATVRFA